MQGAFYLPVLTLVLLTILNDGCILTIVKDRASAPPSSLPPLLPSPPSSDRPIAWPWQVVPSPRPEHWNLPEIFAVSAALGAHLVVINVGMVSRRMPPKAPC